MQLWLLISVYMFRYSLDDEQCMCVLMSVMPNMVLGVNQYSLDVDQRIFGC